MSRDGGSPQSTPMPTTGVAETKASPIVDGLVPGLAGAAINALSPGMLRAEPTRTSVVSGGDTYEANRQDLPSSHEHRGVSRAAMKVMAMVKNPVWMKHHTDTKQHARLALKKFDEIVGMSAEHMENSDEHGDLYFDRQCIEEILSGGNPQPATDAITAADEGRTVALEARKKSMDEMSKDMIEQQMHLMKNRFDDKFQDYDNDPSNPDLRYSNDGTLTSHAGNSEENGVEMAKHFFARNPEASTVKLTVGWESGPDWAHPGPNYKKAMGFVAEGLRQGKNVEPQVNLGTRGKPKWVNIMEEVRKGSTMAAHSSGGLKGAVSGNYHVKVTRFPAKLVAALRVNDLHQESIKKYGDNMHGWLDTIKQTYAKYTGEARREMMDFLTREMPAHVVTQLRTIQPSDHLDVENLEEPVNPLRSDAPKPEQKAGAEPDAPEQKPTSDAARAGADASEEKAGPEDAATLGAGAGAGSGTGGRGGDHDGSDPDADAPDADNQPAEDIEITTRAAGCDLSDLRQMGHALSYFQWRANTQTSRLRFDANSDGTKIESSDKTSQAHLKQAIDRLQASRSEDEFIHRSRVVIEMTKGVRLTDEKTVDERSGLGGSLSRGWKGFKSLFSGRSGERQTQVGNFIDAQYERWAKRNSDNDDSVRDRLSSQIKQTFQGAFDRLGQSFADSMVHNSGFAPSRADLNTDTSSTPSTPVPSPGGSGSQ